MKKIKRLICRCIGHNEFEEVYAELYFNEKYRVVRDIKCSRCGDISNEYLSGYLSRAELLKQGWFILK